MRPLLWALSAAALLACRPRVDAPAARATSAPAAAPGADAFAAAAGDASLAFAALNRAERTCRPLRTTAVSVEEELSAGWLLAVDEVLSAQGVFLDVPAGGSEKWGATGRVPPPPPGPKAELSLWVNRVGKYVAAGSERPGLPWTFVVLASDVPASHSTPGGFVFVTTGLVRLLENEAQLAGVLGHEVGHVAARHNLEAWQEGRFATCKALLATAAVARAGPTASLPVEPPGAKSLALLSPQARDRVAMELEGAAPLGRIDLRATSSPLVQLLAEMARDVAHAAGRTTETELSADEVAATLMVFSGYNPAEYEKLLAKLPAEAHAHHPPLAERLRRLAAVRERYADFEPDGLAAPEVKALLAPLTP